LNNIVENLDAATLEALREAYQNNGIINGRAANLADVLFQAGAIDPIYCEWAKQILLTVYSQQLMVQTTPTLLAKVAGRLGIGYVTFGNLRKPIVPYKDYPMLLMRNGLLYVEVSEGCITPLPVYLDHCSGI
jgi:hypothetical protein